MNKNGALNVLIADPRQLMAEGVRHLLLGCAGVAGVEIVAPLAGDEALPAALRAADADVLLLNPRRGGIGGAVLVGMLRAAAPATAILALASDADSDAPLGLLRAGAKGYVSRDCGPDDLVQAVLKVGAGGIYVPHSLAELIAADPGGGPRADGYRKLSPREAQVFDMLAHGQTVSQIGATLGLSVKTVSTHKSRMMERLGLHTLSELVQYALSHGLMGRGLPAVRAADAETLLPRALQQVAQE